jgi:hypothetical protein
MPRITKEKKEVVKFYLEKEVRAELQQYAEWSEIPQSQVVADALARYFASDKFYLIHKQQQGKV